MSLFVSPYPQRRLIGYVYLHASGCLQMLEEQGRKLMELVTGLVGGLSAIVALYLFYILLKGGDE